MGEKEREFKAQSQAVVISICEKKVYARQEDKYYCTANRPTEKKD